MTIRSFSKEEAWQITCHEAGHGVAGVVLAVRFEHIEIGDRDNSEHGLVRVGVTLLEKFDHACSEDEILKWQWFYVARAAAENLLFRSYRTYGSREDMRIHGKFEELRNTKRVDGWDCDVLAVTRKLVREYAEKVAAELNLQEPTDEGKKRLTDEQVYDLLGKKPLWDTY